MVTLVERGAARAYRPLSTPARVAVLAAAGVAADVAFDPTHRHVPLCPLHSATGAWCPFCGGLRAVDALAHGDMMSALRANLIIVAAVPILLALWVDWLHRRRSGRPPRRASRATWLAVFVACAVFTIVRNLPVAAALHP